MHSICLKYNTLIPKHTEFEIYFNKYCQAASIPFTLFDALTRSWPLPYSWISCRFVGRIKTNIANPPAGSLIKTFPCVAAFMSSLTIVCVALDRFRCIVQSDRTQVRPLTPLCPSYQSIEFSLFN